MVMTIGSLLTTLWLATAVAPAAPAPAAKPPVTKGPGTKVPAALGQEMAEAIVAVNKALGLESWPAHGAQPCVDRGGEGSQTKDVSADDTRRCAGEALTKGFPALGKGYALAILMTSGGPSTVIALGQDEANGFGAYSCDPGRKCLPTRMQDSTKWGKRLIERQQKACGASDTVWFPAGARVCPTAP